MSDEAIDEGLRLLAALKVGGSYWGSQPQLPAARYTLVKIRDSAVRSEALRGLADQPIVVWRDGDPHGHSQKGSANEVPGECDPWHMVGGAAQVIVDADDELAMVAAVAGVPVRCVGPGVFAELQASDVPALHEAFRQCVADGYINPFTGQAMSVLETIELCGFWRRLIDSNRDLTAALGFAFWKRPTVAPLLWSGSGDVPFVSRIASVSPRDRIAIWKARTDPAAVAALEKSGAQLIEVEDGFIRSAGLGADCVPPLSIVVDKLAAYFDPHTPSELELLLDGGDFSPELLERARRLRALVVESGLTKYASGHGRTDRRDPSRRHILVPGQVEDDRAVTAGGLLTSNLELLRAVRQRAPDAYILYKPHPDIEAGHRVGAIADDLCLSVADEIVRDQPISALIDLVDEVHVNTSLAGFEALLRDKPVTTYGVPFYAGWGLTNDLGPVPRRRTARRTLDELVAAVLLQYPRYLDPVTGLPCPAEILVQRLSESTAPRPDGLVVRLRKLQGRCRRGLDTLRTSLVAG
jgi:capsular polysaccharide export protein